ncbi:acyltransferase family protein [Nocardioides panacihumi]|uniref:Acyltransferase family protein n=1 Tax=Nocardioides panacihumi TaxID=400774 RepID=A0ABN2R3W3_9ACTN
MTRPATAHPGVTYRPALDGLRSVAVYLVVAFHAGMASVAGGFLGVDIFFVLSGYLVTLLVIGDLHGDRFTLLGFYNRRVRRLLPAALLVLGTVCVVWLLIASPIDRAAIIGDARSAALYYSNWHFAGQATNYFAHNNNPTPFLHFWSLSVEEQFYVAWPLTMVAVWRLSRRNPSTAPRRLLLVSLAAAALSLVALVLTLRAGQTDLAYYGTHTRVYQLLGGAALAAASTMAPRLMSVPGRAAVAVQVMALAAIVVLASGMLHLDPSVRGIAAAAATIALLWSLEANPAGAGARLLSLSWLVYLGQISYGTYLWHYPVTVVVRRFADMPPWQLYVLVAIVATGLAALSQQLLELPIRKSRHLAAAPRMVVVAGIAASLVAGVVALPRILESPRLPTISAVAPHTTNLPADERTSLTGLDLQAATQIPRWSDVAGTVAKDQICLGSDLDKCIVHHGHGKRVLLMGDSHAGMLVPALAAIARRDDLTLATAWMSACAWPQGLMFVQMTPEASDTCTAAKKHWYEYVIPRFKPDLIVVPSRATDHTIGAAYAVKSVDPGIHGSISHLLSRTVSDTARELAAKGYGVAIVEPVPISNDNVMSCLSGARFADQCQFPADGPSRAERSYRRLAREVPGVHDIDIDPIVCPRLPMCDAVTSGMVTRLDHDHLTPRFSVSIAGELDDLLHQEGAL